MESCFFFALLIPFIYFAESCHGEVLFSSLPQTLAVTASPHQNQVLNSREDSITVSWSLNQSLPGGTDELYKTVKVKLCYAPISQVDRAWRKTSDNLSKDKTCQFTIADEVYQKNHQSVERIVDRDVPTATYFLRVFAYDSAGEEVGYGQTSDTDKIGNLFEIKGISGRHLSLDIASVCFSAFSLVSLVGFFLVEKRKRKLSARN